MQNHVWVYIIAPTLVGPVDEILLAVKCLVINSCIFLFLHAFSSLCQIPETTTRATIWKAAYISAYTRDSVSSHSSRQKNNKHFFYTVCYIVLSFYQSL